MSSDDDVQLVTFKVAGQDFAFDIFQVERILRYEAPAPLPRTTSNVPPATPKLLQVRAVSAYHAAAEITHIQGVRIAPDVPAAHPAFDVTPARYIAAIFTERGVAKPPYTQSLRSLASEKASA